MSGTNPKALARRKKKTTNPEPDFLSRQKSALRRTHRQVIYLNDSEKAAVEEYCSRYGVKTRSVIFREAAMERILAQLDEDHPTLF
jgi:Ribbon-helix-helix protein, copG family.